MVTRVRSSGKENVGAVLDLDGEFTSWREDENADLTALRLLRSANETLDRRNEESESFSGTSTGLCEATRQIRTWFSTASKLPRDDGERLTDRHQ
jgi:hypothetical protein